MHVAMPHYFGTPFVVVHAFTVVHPVSHDIECFTLVTDKTHPGHYEVRDKDDIARMVFSSDSHVLVPGPNNTLTGARHLRHVGNIRARPSYYNRRQELYFEHLLQEYEEFPDVWSTYWGPDVWNEIRLKIFQSYYFVSKLEESGSNTKNELQRI